MPPTTRSNGHIAPPVVAPIAPLPTPTPAELETEYVAGGGYSWYSRLARALPVVIDDITADFGDDLYERMSVDPTIAKCLQIFQASILEDGVELNSAIKDETDSDYELAMQIRDEAEAMLEDLETSLDDVLWDMTSCIALGNVVAEQRYELKPGFIEKRELLQLVALKPKPRRTYAFVVDAYTNVVGLLGQRPGESNPYMGQTVLDPADSPNILPREKFAIATFRPRKGDPRGTSILRSAYDDWWKKRQLYPEFLKYLTQFGSPSLWGTTPEKAQRVPPEDSFANPTLDTNGNLSPPFTPDATIPTTTDWFGNNPKPSGAWTLSPEQAMINAFVAFRNSTAMAFPFGSEVHAIEMQGNGEAFLQAFAFFDRNIIGAILTQTLATEEGQHQARAAAQVHQDVLDTLIRQGKRSVIRLLRRDVLRPWVRYNWGEKALHLVPIPSLGHTEPQDLAGLITALASVGYSIDQSQMAAIDEIVNLPVRDMTQGLVGEDGTAGGSPTPPLPSGDGRPGEGAGVAPSSSQAGPTSQEPPVPTDRVPVRGHDRGRPARANMAAEKAAPKVGRRPGAGNGAYSDGDRRLLVELFDDAFPEAAGLLDAKVSDGG